MAEPGGGFLVGHPLDPLDQLFLYSHIEPPFPQIEALSSILPLHPRQDDPLDEVPLRKEEETR
jgi:hypothetical protein